MTTTRRLLTLEIVRKKISVVNVNKFQLRKGFLIILPRLSTFTLRALGSGNNNSFACITLIIGAPPK
jgi:hypothetical protein